MSNQVWAVSTAYTRPSGLGESTEKLFDVINLNAPRSLVHHCVDNHLARSRKYMQGLKDPILPSFETILGGQSS